MEIKKNTLVNKFFSILISLTLLSAFISTYYNYMIKMEHNYLVEEKCNPDTEKCFYRDCDGDPDSCPPNNFSYYKIFNIKAHNFSRCEDGSCKNVCSLDESVCQYISCEENEGNMCVGM